ncbi:MAG: hypothetical protein D8M58_17775 [Calditrichaeota bacterium]|nr:MAG: hypothetical protein DWQ03_01690 [Calditrichota bacterium]MBL1207257.1 hypothetical protein [Calditrichota bacterium]NOG47090.1 hypothetical protein [Calditrichota bacterium]
MAITYDLEFDFEKGPYIFGFRPNTDDFSVVEIEQTKKTGGVWKLVRRRPFVETHCLECVGNISSESESWVFSRGFKLYRDKTYQAIIYYRGGGDLFTTPTKFYGVKGKMKKNNARLNLWLCREQNSKTRIRSLIEVGISHKQYQYLSVMFKVSEDRIYFFGGQALIRKSTARVALGLNGLIADSGKINQWL